jgi:HlyD family secretion protein
MKNGLDTMDTLLGYTDRTTDDDFEGVLGVLSPQSKNTAKSAFLAAYEAHTALEKNHITLPLEVRSIEEVKLLIAPMNTALSLNKTALLAQRTVLEKSITSNLFTQDDLESYRKEVSAHIVEMDTRLSALSSAYQSYADLLLTDTSQGATSTTELGQKENAVQIAEQALENTRASAREERTKLSTRIKDAEEEVKKAEQQLMNEQVTWKAKVKEAEEAVRASEGVVKVRRAELAKVSAVPRSVDLAPYEAEVQKAEVEKATQEKALRDMTLLAPEKGYITKIEKEIGEKLSPEENYMVMQTLDQAVVVQVSETDIAKISLDAVVNMTFDAFSYTETFTGKVTKIDPAETVIDGVTYYKVTVTLDVVNAAIKSGMTANMEIVTAQKKDVLLVPALSVKYDKDVRYVEILSNDIPERRTVTLGIEGDRYAEILSGLQEGDRVITYVKK